ncbi:MAG: hypothetical protein HQM10_11050 [Candidatus Riflebacteria bacterium]|nr:hypothetical protein [Candidatus Riflebacteria bacterium]
MFQSYPVVLAFAWYFLTMCAVYFLMPIRGAFLMKNLGSEILPYAFMSNALTTALVVWIYGSFAHLPRRQIIGGTLIVLLSSMFIWLFAAVYASTIGWVSFLFSVWLDIFVILAATIFWTSIDDIFTFEGAKSTFGFIASAASLGAIFGSTLSTFFVQRIGTTNMLLLACLTFAAILPVFHFLDKWAVQNGHSKKKNKEEAVREIKDLSQFIEVGRMIVSSRLLSLLTIAICFECLVPNLMTYILSLETSLAYPGTEEMTQAFSGFFMITNILAFLVSVLTTSWVFEKVGIAGAMASCAVFSIGGFAAFAVFPVLISIVIADCLGDTVRFTLHRSGKEAVYTVAPREVVYRVKAYIEVFVYRFVSGASGLLLLFLTGKNFLAFSSKGVAMVGIPLSIAWWYAVYMLGMEFRKSKSEADQEENKLKLN